VTRHNSPTTTSTEKKRIVKHTGGDDRSQEAAEDLVTLTQAELRVMAKSQGVPASGTKVTIACKYTLTQKNTHTHTHTHTSTYERTCARRSSEDG
jgi:hypothetical protein